MDARATPAEDLIDAEFDATPAEGNPPSEGSNIDDRNLSTPALSVIRELAARLERPLDIGVDSLVSPGRLRAQLEAATGGAAIVTGPLDNRLVLVELSGGDWLAANLERTGFIEANTNRPQWFREGVEQSDPTSHISQTSISEDAMSRLLAPRVLLVALYHPENFPLPRFPLGISDVARAARLQLCATVDMIDMQLGADLVSVKDAVDRGQYDVVGISATFGQHDIQQELLTHIYQNERPPTVVSGGSLTARNEEQLLEDFPQLLIARGAGETTMSDVIDYVRGDVNIAEVRGLGYFGAARGDGTLQIGFRRNGTVSNRLATEFAPELDLLQLTFECHGVAQLEASRGCTNYCSFCPRGHKGMWSRAEPEAFLRVMASMAEVLNDYPHISRTLYLVDEEFIGRDSDSLERAKLVADACARNGLTWETSCRVDQIADPAESGQWHQERAEFWTYLKAKGLRRCLFGIESGVTSILERFNKDATADQNALAVRTLSALGVPTRFTYITFDQLMTMEELHETLAFQGRTDLLLKPRPDLTPEDLIAGVSDATFVRANTTGRPFYSAISYMLVTMECLNGAAYTRRAIEAGLTDGSRTLMGSASARFADWRIGVISHHSQLWIDRNFALDYTLKSLEKITSGDVWSAIREARVLFKDAAFSLVTRMVGAAEDYDIGNNRSSELGELFYGLLEAEFASLGPLVSDATARISAGIEEEQALALVRQFEVWSQTIGWRLINAPDAC